MRKTHEGREYADTRRAKQTRACSEDTQACAFSRETSSVNLSISSLQRCERSDSAGARRGSAQISALDGVFDSKHARVMGDLRRVLYQVQTRLCPLKIAIHLLDRVTERRREQKQWHTCSLCAAFALFTYSKDSFTKLRHVITNATLNHGLARAPSHLSRSRFASSCFSCCASSSRSFITNSLFLRRMSSISAEVTALPARCSIRCC